MSTLTEIEYETFFDEVHKKTKKAGTLYSRCETWKARGEGIRKYGFAVPNHEALKALAGCPKPIVEIGAGLAYWASLVMIRHGVVIECYDRVMYGRDKETDYTFEGPPYHPVCRGGEENIRPEHATLVLIWPDYESDMAYDCLRNFQGSTLVYVGEARGGCTGSASFFNELDNWELQQEIAIPQFYGIHDAMRIYTRT